MSSREPFILVPVCGRGTPQAGQLAILASVKTAYFKLLTVGSWLAAAEAEARKRPLPLKSPCSGHLEPHLGP